MHFRIIPCLIGLSLSVVSCQLPASKPPPKETTSVMAANHPYSTDELQKRTFLYFWEQALPGNYQIPDRWPTERFSSIAATGFGLTAYIVGAERGFVSRSEAAERTLLTLETLWKLPQGPEGSGVSGYKGFFYHFLTNDKAHRYKQVELSSIDTGLLMAGVLSAQSYFDGNSEAEQAIRKVADLLYRRVEWDWMLNEEGRLSMGYHPEKGFIKADWQGYNEAMILLVLAMGSPTHPIPAEAWSIWCSTYEWDTFQGRAHLNFEPLFGHQYSQMYIDFRDIQDPFMKGKNSDYFQNSRIATLTNREYCIDNPQGFKGYGENCWGLTACDGPGGLDTAWNGKPVRFFSYRARGASAQRIIDDGTLAPTAVGGSVPFAPEVCLSTLEYMWDTYHDHLIGQYGFKDAFNPTYTFCEGCEDGWFDHDYLGIDQGPILLQMENYRTGLVWEVMHRNPYIVGGLRKAGFEGGWLEQRTMH